MLLSVPGTVESLQRQRQLRHRSLSFVLFQGPRARTDASGSVRASWSATPALALVALVPIPAPPPPLSHIFSCKIFDGRMGAAAAKQAALQSGNPRPALGPDDTKCLCLSGLRGEHLVNIYSI